MYFTTQSFQSPGKNATIFECNVFKFLLGEYIIDLWIFHVSRNHETGLSTYERDYHRNKVNAKFLTVLYLDLILSHLHSFNCYVVDV